MTQSTKKTARKTTATKTAPAAPLFTPRVPQGIIDFQKRLLENQQNLFDRGYETLSGLQDRQEEAVKNLLERSTMVPGELRQLNETWADARRQLRETYRLSVERSFELLGGWVNSWAESEA